MCVYVQTHYLIIKFGRRTCLHYDQNDHNEDFIALMRESAMFNSIEFLFSTCMWCSPKWSVALFALKNNTL